MNQLYAKARERYLTGAADWTVENMSIALVDGNYLFDENDEFLSDVTAGSLIATKIFGSRTADDGFANGLGSSFGALTWPLPLTYILLFVDSGDPATSELVAYYDTVTGLPTNLTGGDYSILPDSVFGGYFRL